MKNIYNITKGQIITIWIFGIFLWLSLVQELEWSDYFSLVFFGVPALLIFYTIGWRNNQKISKGN